MIVTCFSLFLVRSILGGITLEIIEPATWTRIMVQQPRLNTRSVEDMVASWIVRPTYLIPVSVVYQTNWTSRGCVIVVVIVGKDQVAFLSLQEVALVIFPHVRLSNDMLLLFKMCL
jgi:hypothetical protein